MIIKATGMDEERWTALASKSTASEELLPLLLYGGGFSQQDADGGAPARLNVGDLSRVNENTAITFELGSVDAGKKEGKRRRKKKKRESSNMSPMLQSTEPPAAAAKCKNESCLDSLIS